MRSDRASVSEEAVKPGAVASAAEPIGRASHGAPSLRGSAASGMLWQGLSYVLGRLGGLVTTLVLARMLVPEDFGLVALATVFITYIDAFSDLGVAQALIYLPRTAQTVRAAQVCAMASGAVLLAGAMLGANGLAALFGDVHAAPLLRLLGLSLFANALASVPQSLLRRDLQFRRLGAAAVLRSAAVGIVSISLAAIGLGAFALVWGTVAGNVVYAVACWVLVPSRPSTRLWKVRRADVRAVLGFGVPAAGGMLLSRLIFDVDYLIVGRQLGVQSLGFYTLAFRMPELLIINVFFVVSSVTFPLYARARQDPERLRRGYLTSVRIQAAYGVCAGLGVAAVAPVLVPVLLGDQWVPAVTAVVPLALYAALRSLGAGANDLYKAIGRPGISVWISLLRLVVLVPALLFATRWGFTGVAWAQAAAAAAFVVLMQGTALRVMRGRLRDLLRALVPGVAAGCAAGGAALIVVLALPAPDAVVLALAAVAGFLAAAATLRVAAPGFDRELLAMIKRKKVSAR